MKVALDLTSDEASRLYDFVSRGLLDDFSSIEPCVTCSSKDRHTDGRVKHLDGCIAARLREHIGEALDAHCGGM